MTGFLLLLPAGAISADDSYIAGYATAVLEQAFRLTGATLRVKNGVITVNAGTLGGLDPEKVSAALKKISGVVRVEVRETKGQFKDPESISQRAVETTLPPLQPKFLPQACSSLHCTPTLVGLISLLRIVVSSMIKTSRTSSLRISARPRKVAGTMRSVHLRGR